VIYSIYDDNFDREKILDRADISLKVAQETNPEILEKLNQFTLALEALGQRKVERLQLIQGLGIGIAIVYFFALMFYFIRRLSNSDHAAESARRETEEILTTINEGLFLLDKKLTIGSQHSKALCSLFNIEKPADSNFLELIQPMVSEKTFATAKEFLGLMFEDHVEPSLIQSLNPLNVVEMHIAQAKGKFETKYYSFQFFPVEKEGKLLHILVSIIDISERIQLENELDKSRKQSSQEVELLLSILHIKPELLASGLSSTEKGLSEINLILKSSSNSDSEQLQDAP